jgi:hypothetical protein
VLNNRDGKDITTTINYSAATIDVSTSDYQQRTYLGGDGSTLAVADRTLIALDISNFGTGRSQVIYQYDGIGRVISETTTINQSGVETPSTRVTTTYSGSVPASRSVAIAASGATSGFTNAVTTNYDIDARGRVDQMGQDFQNTSLWRSGTLPADLAIEAIYEVDGQIDRIDRYVGDDTLAGGTRAIISGYDYRGDGVLEQVRHDRDTFAASSIAQHGIDRLADGRALTGTAAVYSRTGIELGQATRTYSYDSRGNANNISVGNPGDSDHYFRYDNEGRLVRDFIDDFSSNTITDIAYDIAGRLRSVKETVDPAVGFDSVTTTEHAYDAVGRRVATRHVPSSGPATVEGFYGASGMPELTFAAPTVPGTTSGVIKLHQSTLPGVAGVVAINGHDGSGQTVWTLPDYGGSTRAYASANPDGSLSALLHQNFDGQGVPISVIDQSNGKFSGDTLPVHFAGYQLDKHTDLYFVGGAVAYDPESGRRLASSSGGGNDRYSLETDYANLRLPNVQQQTYGGVFWEGYKELLSDPSKLDNGYRQAFYVSATVAGVASVAAGGIVLAAGAGIGSIAGTSAIYASAATGAGIGTGISVGMAAYKGESLATASLVGAGAGLIGGAGSQ